MGNNYVDFIEDDHFLKCIGNLHAAYVSAKEKISKKKFYKNKVDTIKLTFDTTFNGVDQESIIETEILRQIDKSINNSIGTFHEEILGGIVGFETGNQSGYDIKANDGSLFADVKNKHNTMNSSSAEALFQKLARFADDNKEAKCYWVQILANGSFNKLWKGQINGKEYSHSRVYKISGDQFYRLLTGRDNAFFELYTALPVAIKDFLDNSNQKSTKTANSALQEIKEETLKSSRPILDQITFENFSYYLGFDRL